MTAKRWLVLGSHVPAAGGLGGMIRCTVETTRSLVDRDDAEVYVHCIPQAIPFFVDEVGVRPDRLIGTATGTTIRDSLFEFVGLGPTIRDRGIDVVFGSKQLVPYRAHGATRLLVVHDMLALDRPKDFGRLKRTLLPHAYRQSLRRAEILVCGSGAARDQLARYEQEAADRAVVVTHAMTPVLQEAPLEPISSLVERPFALCVGDLSPRKNVGFLLKIWPEVMARVPDAHLTLAGPPGWGQNAVLPELEALTAAGAVSHLGRVSDGALRWAYQNARVTLCPSLLEGFGLPVIEALLLGSPTVISTDPAQVEVSQGAAPVIPVSDGGRWVEAIVEHFESPRCSLPRMQQRGWDDVAAEMVALAAAAPVGR